MRKISDIEREYSKFNNLIPSYISFAKMKMETNVLEALGVYKNAERFSKEMIEDAILLNDEEKVERAENFLSQSKDGIAACKEKQEKTK